MSKEVSAVIPSSCLGCNLCGQYFHPRVLQLVRFRLTNIKYNGHNGVQKKHLKLKESLRCFWIQRHTQPTQLPFLLTPSLPVLLIWICVYLRILPNAIPVGVEFHHQRISYYIKVFFQRIWAEMVCFTGLE